MNPTESKPARGRPSTRNKAQVLEAAMHAYWHDDRAATSVNAVCALAGVSKPSLYRDFGSEDGLTAAVIERYAQDILDPVQTLLESPAGFNAKLDAMIDFASQDPRMHAGCLFVKMRATRTRFGAQTQARISAIEAKALASYTRFFAQSTASGERSSTVPAHLAAAYLQEQFGLAFTLRAAGHGPELVRPMLVLAISVLR